MYNVKLNRVNPNDRECESQRFVGTRVYVCGSVAEGEYNRLLVTRLAMMEHNADTEVLVPDPQPDANIDDILLRVIERIKQADVVICVPKSDGSIDDSTRWERAIALAERKQVYNAIIEEE